MSSYKPKNKNRTSAVEINLLDIADVQGGDLCYDIVLKSFFICSPAQINEIKKRNSSFWIVDHQDRVDMRDRLMRYHEICINGEYPIDLFKPRDY